MSSKDSFIKHKKDADVASIWNHYLVAKDGLSAKCKQCPAVLKTLGGSTKGLHTHLSSKHKSKVASTTQPSTSSTVQPSTSSTTQPSTSGHKSGEEPPLLKRKRSSVANYFVKTKTDTLDDILARMTALDGIPFSVFITSNDLRELLRSKGFSDLPKAASTVRNHVVNYSNRIRNEMKLEFNELKKSDQRFSLSYDEWTSSSNKRYMNVNIHGNSRFWNLGLIRISMSLNAEACVEVLKERLCQFDISLEKDIVAIVTDGPNVMLKVGKIVNSEHQVCFAHGIHLAVCDLLYKNTTITAIDPPTSQSDWEENDDEDLESGLVIESECPPDLTDEHNIKDIIRRVRKVVVLFKRSSLKNDTILQKYVKVAHGKELSLLLDCKTRWNSLLTMLERFLLLKVSIQKALLDLNSTVLLEESDFKVIQEIINVLSPVKLTVEALCRSDANLCTADAALRFLFKQLNDNPSILASKFKSILFERIKHRRQAELSGVLSYLRNLSDNADLEDKLADLFQVPSKALIKRKIASLTKNLNPHNKLTSSTCDCNEPQNPDLSLNEKLQAEIDKSMKIQERPMETDCDKVIRQEMNLFETLQCSRGYILEQAYNYLLTIPPTSIEPERAFSAAAYMCSKIRSRLGDDTLDALLFLRAYFRNTENRFSNR